MTGFKWGWRVSAATFLAGCAFAAPAPAGWADSPEATPGTDAAANSGAAAVRAAPARSTERRARAAAPLAQAAQFASAPAAPSAAPRITRRPLQDMTARLIRGLTPYSDWLADYPGPPSPPMLQGALDLLRRSLDPTVGALQRSHPEWSKPTALKLENALDTAIFVAEVHGDSADPDSQSRVLAEPVSLAPGAVFVGSPNGNGLPNYVQVTKLWLWISTPPVKEKPEYELVVMTPFVLEPPDGHPLARPKVTVWDDSPPFDNWWALEPPTAGRAGGKAFFPEGALFFATERTDDPDYPSEGNKDFYWVVTKTISKNPV